jgi:integrase
MEHLVKLNGYYYLRLRVPLDMQGVLRIREIKKALHTKQSTHAKVMAKAYDYQLSRIFTLSRCGMLSDGDIRVLVDEFMRKKLEQFEDERAQGIGVPRCSDLEGAESDFVSRHYEGCEVGIEQCRKALVHNNLNYIRPTVDEVLQEKELVADEHSLPYKRLCRRVLRGLIDVYEIEKKRILGDYSKSFSRVSPLRNKPEIQQNLHGAKAQQGMNTGRLLSEVMNEYMKLKSENWKHKTRSEMKHIYRLALDVLCDRDIKTLTLKDFLEYRDVLKVLPSNFYKKKEYKDKTIPEIVHMVEANPVEPIAAKTQYKNIQSISGLMKWCVKKQYCTINHAEGLAVKKKGKGKSSRKPFATEDIKALLASPVYRENDYKDRPERFWIPLIGLFTGARLNEICSLYLSDIIKSGDIPCFDFKEDTEDKSLKNENSRRVVPIHPVLIEMGFLDYVDSLRKEGKERVFSNLTHTKDNGYAGAFGKWFGRHNRDYITKDKAKVFHSFRNTVEDALKQQGVDHKLMEEITGHEDQSMSSGYYANPYQAKLLLEALLKLDYVTLFKGVRFNFEGVKNDRVDF